MSIFLLNVPPNRILAMQLQYKTWVEFMYEILFSVPPPTKTKSGAAPDSHPVITISHDEVIDIFAFSSAHRLNFTL